MLEFSRHRLTLLRMKVIWKAHYIVSLKAKLPANLVELDAALALIAVVKQLAILLHMCIESATEALEF